MNTNRATGCAAVSCSCSLLLVGPSLGSIHRAEFPLIAVFRFLGPPLLEDLLKEGNARDLNKLVAAAKTNPKVKAAMVEESSITFGRLFTNPGKIVCIGLNYRAHAAEANEKLPWVPILFNKYNNALAPHNCTIKLPPKEVSYKFDYETEL